LLNKYVFFRSLKAVLGQCVSIFVSFGNFVNRTLKFVSSQYNGVIPESGDIPGPLSPNDAMDGDFISDVNALIKDYTDAMEAVKLRLGVQTVMLISIRGNNYLQSSGLNKALMTENPTRCGQVLSRAVNLIYVLSALVYPFMPAISDSILVQLNAPARAIPEVLSTDILFGHHIGRPEHLFKKIEETMADVWRNKFGGLDNTGDASASDGPALSKRKAAAAKKAKTVVTPDTGIKSPEFVALEAKVTKQGELVRSLKGQAQRTGELKEQVTLAVEELKRLKAKLADLGNS
jgi:methionyl-tRNA synthetase